MKTVSKLTKIGFSEYFKYDENSPSGLVYCKSLINKRKVKGDIAGIKQYDEEEKPKRWILWFKGKSYSAHRIILLLCGTLKDNLIVDHLDGNPFNNKIENLRMTFFSVNNKNKAKFKNNKTGITGVFYVEYTNKQSKLYKYFVGSFSNNGVELVKRFSVNKLGEDLAKQLAINFRNNGIIQDNEYTERHGK